jgi:hypothetical protein
VCTKPGCVFCGGQTGRADTFTYAFDYGGGYGSFTPSSSATCDTPTNLDSVSARGKIRDDDGGVTEYSVTVEVAVTFDSLCALTRQYSSSAKVADDLCSLLDEAELATTSKLRQKRLDDSAKKVDKQAGAAFTRAEAATLIDLARGL